MPNYGNNPYNPMMPPCMQKNQHPDYQNQYIMPQNQHMMPQGQYGMPQNQYMMPQGQYGMPQNQYMMPPNQYMPDMDYMMDMEQYMMPMMSDIERDAYSDPQNMMEAVNGISNALGGETEDRLFYEYLMQNATSEEDKEIIKGIREDEIKHYKMFHNLYYELTGSNHPKVKEQPFEKPASYVDGLAKAIIGEQNAVRKYRKIMFALRNTGDINKMIEIITDEIRHGILYNYLYSKNKHGSK